MDGIFMFKRKEGRCIVVVQILKEGRRKDRLTNSLRGTIGNKELVRGRRIRSRPNKFDVDVENGNLSRFGTSLRRRTSSGHLRLGWTDFNVVSGVDNGDAAVYTGESAGARVVASGDDVRDAQGIGYGRRIRLAMDRGFQIRL